jgi:hypothetical protein
MEYLSVWRTKGTPELPSEGLLHLGAFYDKKWLLRAYPIIEKCRGHNFIHYSDSRLEIVGVIILYIILTPDWRL